MEQTQVNLLEEGRKFFIHYPGANPSETETVTLDEIIDRSKQGKLRQCWIGCEPEGNLNSFYFADFLSRVEAQRKAQEKKQGG